jgi:hypothetical protein
LRFDLIHSNWSMFMKIRWHSFLIIKLLPNPFECSELWFDFDLILILIRISRLHFAWFRYGWPMASDIQSYSLGCKGRYSQSIGIDRNSVLIVTISVKGASINLKEQRSGAIESRHAIRNRHMLRMRLDYVHYCLAIGHKCRIICVRCNRAIPFRICLRLRLWSQQM